MNSTDTSICIECGQSAGDPPVLNNLPDGRPCAGCRDRVLDALPAILPHRGEVEVEVEVDADVENGVDPEVPVGEVDDEDVGLDDTASRRSFYYQED